MNLPAQNVFLFAIKSIRFKNTFLLRRRKHHKAGALQAAPQPLVQPAPHGSPHGLHGSQHGSTVTQGSQQMTFRSGWNREFQAYRQHSTTRHPLETPSIAANTERTRSLFMLSLFYRSLRGRISFRPRRHGRRSAAAWVAWIGRRATGGGTGNRRRRHGLICRTSPQTVPEPAPGNAHQQRPYSR